MTPARTPSPDIPDAKWPAVARLSPRCAGLLLRRFPRRYLRRYRPDAPGREKRPRPRNGEKWRPEAISWIGRNCSEGDCGVRGGIRTHGPRIHTTSAFTAAMSMAFVVWTVPSPWTAGGLQVLPIQSLHLASSAGLGSGLARLSPERSPNLSRSAMGFPIMAPNLKTRNPVLYPAELRGHTTRLLTEPMRVGKVFYARGPGQLPFSAACVPSAPWRTGGPHAAAPARYRGCRSACRPVPAPACPVPLPAGSRPTRH